MENSLKPQFSCRKSKSQCKTRGEVRASARLTWQALTLEARSCRIHEVTRRNERPRTNQRGFLPRTAILQLVPFQCSTRAPPLTPTAQTSLDETAATPDRLEPSTADVGVDTSVQLVPFQCSVSDRPKSGL